MPLGSWYSQLPPFGWFDFQDRPNSAAYQVNGRSVPDSQQGIALPTRGGLGKWYNVTPPGSDRPYPLQQTDIGPAPWTGRGVDISAAGANQMGYTPKTFPTDANFKVDPIDLTGLGLAAGYMGGVPGNNDTAVASGPSQGRKMPSSLMDMFQPQSLTDQQPTDFGTALQQRSNSLIGLGLGMLTPRNLARGDTPSSMAAALQGYQQGAALDSAQASRQAALQHQKTQDARQAAMDRFNMSMQERQFARGDITDAQRTMRDLYGDNATPEQKSGFMKSYYASKTDPGAWILKDIVDPRDPSGETKITVQEHNRTGEIRSPQFVGGGDTATAGPATNWDQSAQNAPVYGAGSGGFSAPPTVGAAPGQPQQKTRPGVTGATGIVYTPPAGLSKDGYKSWQNHIAMTEADVASGKMTEAQGTSNLYAGKMAIANGMLDPETEKQGLDPTGNRLEKYGGWLGNVALMPKEYQKYRDAKDTFLNAYLRRISGATVHDAEYLREEKVFFPQPGDQPTQVEYKRRLRQDAIERMKQQVGPGYREPPAPSSGQDTAAAPMPAGVPPPPQGFILRQSNR